jgi:hypothetical protein
MVTFLFLTNDDLGLFVLYCCLAVALFLLLFLVNNRRLRLLSFSSGYICRSRLCRVCVLIFFVSSCCVWSCLLHRLGPSLPFSIIIFLCALSSVCVIVSLSLCSFVLSGFAFSCLYLLSCLGLVFFSFINVFLFCETEGSSFSCSFSCC